MVFIIWLLIPYTSLALNLLIIFFMKKRLTYREIYISWFVIALINLSSDVVLSLYFKLYELGESGIQLSVHLLELTLGASYGIIFLNFMPQHPFHFILYSAVWLVYSLLFEILMIRVNFINEYDWSLWLSGLYYILCFWFLRWHLRFIRM